jgi:ribonucleoside-diphosphate reductase alpha chain
MNSKYRWLTEMSQVFLERDYLVDGQTVDQRVDEICNTAEKLLNKPGFAAKFKENFQKGWYSLSTPIWTNFGNERGMPISCFGSSISDSMQSIAYTWAEVAMMTKYGGGTSATFGNLRPRGASIRDNGESSGAVHFMQAFENLIQIVSQGSTRRGNFAAYLPIDHADIMEFLQIRTEGFPIQDLSFGVCVPDYWMEEMINGDADKRKVWAKVLEMRANFGYPYIIFIDNANNNTVDCYKDKGMKITHSNLCSEIFLVDNEDESFVCDLSSMNILYYDEWKDTDAVELLVYLLDAVMTEFIEKAKKIKFMERAVKFAERHRALGVGWLGWHSYLQSKMIPWESMDAKFHNTQIAKNIKDAAYKASAKLAEEYGEPEVCKGYGRRNTTLLAIAPTKSCTTPDTKFKDSNLDNIDYFEFAGRGGLDLHEIMSIEFELDNGQTIKYRYDETIAVKRNGQEILIKACEVAENDIL